MSIEERLERAKLRFARHISAGLGIDEKTILQSDMLNKWGEAMKPFLENPVPFWEASIKRRQELIKKHEIWIRKHKKAIRRLKKLIRNYKKKQELERRRKTV